MNRRNILLYTLAGVFSVIGALTNGISPFLAGNPAAEKIVSLCLAIILILIGVSAITASSRIKKSGNADLRLTKKIMPSLLCVMAIFILVDAAVCIPNFNGLTSGVRIAGDIINSIGFASCGILMLKNNRSEKNAVLYIILSVLSGSISPIMITAAWLALPYDPARERSKLNNLASRAPERYEAQTIALFRLLMSMSKAEQQRYINELKGITVSQKARATAAAFDTPFPQTATVACQGV